MDRSKTEKDFCCFYINEAKSVKVCPEGGVRAPCSGVGGICSLLESLFDF